MSFDKQIKYSESQLRSLGIQDDAHALKNVKLLSAKLGTEGFTSLAPELFACLSKAADPDMALNNLDRFVDNLTNVRIFVPLCRSKRDVLRQLITILGASRYYSTYIVASADDCLGRLADNGYLTTTADQAILSNRLEAIIDGARDQRSFYRALRVFRKQELLRIGLRDLLALPRVLLWALPRDIRTAHREGRLAQILELLRGLRDGALDRPLPLERLGLR